MHFASHAAENPAAPLAVYARLNFFDAQTDAFGELMTIIARATQLDHADAEALWSQGRRPCLFLLDGFNEVAPAAREACALALTELTQNRTHSYVITSRPSDDAERLARQLSAEPLDIVKPDDAQVKHFLASYGVSGLADRLGPKGRELLTTPFFLWALAASEAKLGADASEMTTGRLYQRLVDEYIFGFREAAKIGDARPTKYHYERVKKPVLARIAVEMCAANVTRQADDDLLQTTRDLLQERRVAFDGIYPITAYEVMPDPPAAAPFLQELADNGILRRSLGTLEFSHESIRDYFAAVALSGQPVTETVARTPRLVWRHIEPQFYEYEIRSNWVAALIMAAGLASDPEPLISALADRHPLAAAYCHAEVSTAGTGSTLHAEIRTLLEHPRAVRRWIGCQCAGVAGLHVADLIASLVERMRSDPDSSVQGAAARALGRLGDRETIGSLVAQALAAESTGSGDQTGWVLWQLRSELAVREVFEAWRAAPSGDRRRKRAEKLLAGMGPELVRDSIASIGGKARADDDLELVRQAEEALSQLDAWRSGALMTAEHLRFVMKQSGGRVAAEISSCLAEWAALSTTEVLVHLNDASVAAREAAAVLLQQRKDTAAVGPLLDSLAKEPHSGINERLLDALRPLAGADELTSAWSSRMTDPRSWLVATLPLATASRLSEGALDEETTAELRGLGVALDDRSSVRADGDRWDITPGSWSGERFLNDHSWLRLVTVQNGLEVFDLGRRARLATAGRVLGEPAIPALRRALDADRSDVVTTEAIIDTLGRMGGPIAARELCALLPTTDDGPQRSLNTRLLDALAATRSPVIVQPLLGALRGLGSPHPHEDAGPPSSDDHAESAARLADVLIGLGAEVALVRFAHDAFRDGSDLLRHLATASIARVDRISPTVDDLLIQAGRELWPGTRKLAMSAMGQHETKARRSQLVQACLDDDDSDVRSAAALAIRGYDGDDAIQELIGHLADPSPHVPRGRPRPSVRSATIVRHRRSTKR